jgi:predicted small lipoprotein YifL
MKKLFGLFLLAGVFALATACEKKAPAETPAAEEAAPDGGATPADSGATAPAHQ